MTTVEQKTRWSQQELCDEAAKRFGGEPKDWAFTCPNCNDTATARDFIENGLDPQRVGQECIGRQLGALRGKAPTSDSGRSLAERGCDWAAYGLFRGPWVITLPDGKEAASFPLADATASS